MRRKLLAVLAAAMLMGSAGAALAAPPDNRPPDNRPPGHGHGHGHGGQQQQQQQQQEQSQEQSQCIVVIGLLQPAEC